MGHENNKGRDWYAAGVKMAAHQSRYTAWMATSNIVSAVDDHSAGLCPMTIQTMTICHDCIDHDYIGHDYIGRSSIDHNYTGRDYIGNGCIGHALKRP